MVSDTELAQNGFKEAPPLAIVGFLELEKDGDMGTDVHRLKNSSRDGLGFELAIGIRGRGRGGHGSRGNWRGGRCRSRIGKRID
jgi:hypothetical protein